MRRSTLSGLLALMLLGSSWLAEVARADTPPKSAKQIVLIRPGSSGVLPDEQSVRQLLSSWAWPESITPPPPEGEEGYQVTFSKLESRHDDAILGIVSVSAFSEPQAVRQALQQSIGYLESALTEIGEAIQGSRQGEQEELLRTRQVLEGELEELEAREVELRSANAGEPEHWSDKLEALRNDLASINARIGDQQLRLNMTRDQLAQAKKQAEDSANSGEKTLQALQQLAAMRMDEAKRAEDLRASGGLPQSEVNQAREQLLRAQIQLREKEQELAQQVAAPVRQLSDQQQQMSNELQALEQQRQRFEGELNKLQSPEARGAVIERQRLRRRVDRVRQQLAETDQRIEQLSRRQPNDQPPQVIRIEPKTNVQ